MIKIALSGKYGVGKNTFLDLANELFSPIWQYSIRDNVFRENKFAEPIYDIMYACQNELEEYSRYVYPNQNERCKDGKLLQFLGMHYRKKYGEDFWVKIAFHVAEKPSHMFTDLRFLNEFRACKEKGYTVIRIKRDEDRRKDFLCGRDPNHISETALDDIVDSEFDFVVDNNGTIEDLKNEVERIIKSLDPTLTRIT